MYYQSKAKSTVANSRGMSCPECGTAMCEVHRSNEDSGIFIWYECGKNDCYGQWLEKHPLPQKNSIKALRTFSVQP